MSLKEIEEKYPVGTPITLSGKIFAYTWGALAFFEGEAKYAKEQGYIELCDATVTGIVTAPVNVVAQAVAGIDSQLNTLADEYHAKCAQLRDQKNQLLQITLDAETLPADAFHQPATTFSDIDDDIPF